MRQFSKIFEFARDLSVSFSGMKRSGVGREGGEEALRFFTEVKSVCIAK
jgi:aminomuconate-semialdehyde/2-hydroxymuconate-6-semialdehyde dehydrogenase